jgi:hypothetical protein
MANTLYLYGHRDPILAIPHHLMRLWLSHMGFFGIEHEKLPEVMRQSFMMYFPETASAFDWNVTPYAPIPWKDNSEEYVTRYNPFMQDYYQDQLSAFERMLSACRDKHVQVLLFNMPITLNNMKTMPPGMYDRYLADTKVIAQKYGAKYADFNIQGEWPMSYFVDTVHMNGKGGLVFWKKVMQNWPQSTAQAESAVSQ